VEAANRSNLSSQSSDLSGADSVATHVGQVSSAWSTESKELFQLLKLDSEVVVMSCASSDCLGDPGSPTLQRRL
jgi:hypothetical protein